MFNWSSYKFVAAWFDCFWSQSLLCLAGLSPAGFVSDIIIAWFDPHEFKMLCTIIEVTKLTTLTSRNMEIKMGPLDLQLIWALA